MCCVLYCAVTVIRCDTVCDIAAMNSTSKHDQAFVRTTIVKSLYGMCTDNWSPTTTRTMRWQPNCLHQSCLHRPIGLPASFGHASSLTPGTSTQRRSTTTAGFCKHKDTIHQLQNVIMALEDAKLFSKDIYALIVDFTSAFNTTAFGRMLWIMYDLGLPTDATDAARNLYEHATTQVNLCTRVCTNKIHVKRGTIQGDTLSPLILLLYMNPKMLTRRRKRVHTYLCPKRKHASDSPGQQHK